VVILDAGSYAAYYNNAKATWASAPSAAVVQYTNHGMFSTYSANLLDNFTVFPRGNESQYNALDLFSEVVGTP
jgi:hypothetical protein